MYAISGKLDGNMDTIAVNALVSIIARGSKIFSRRCKHCGCDESPTAHTLFHKIKFGIENAFEMLYDIATSKSKKGASSIWLGERYEVKQTTAWLFRSKAQ